MRNIATMVFPALEEAFPTHTVQAHDRLRFLDSLADVQHPFARSYLKFSHPLLCTSQLLHELLADRIRDLLVRPAQPSYQKPKLVSNFWLAICKTSSWSGMLKRDIEDWCGCRIPDLISSPDLFKILVHLASHPLRCKPLALLPEAHPGCRLHSLPRPLPSRSPVHFCPGPPISPCTFL
jgi:hypothetical protein